MLRKEVKGMGMKNRRRRRRRMHMEKKRRVKAKRRENGESAYVSGTLKAKGIGWTGRRSPKFREFFWFPIFAYSMFRF